MNQEEIVRYYESTGLDYETWSRDFNMHFGYWRPGLSLFQREPMLEEMNRQVQAALGLTEDDRQVYDLGCGLGASMRSLARRHPDKRVTGLTLVPWQVDQADALNAGFPNLEMRVADYTRLPERERADAAYALESCCYAPAESKADFLRNLHGLLKPGGRFAVADGFTKRRRRPSILNGMLRQACEGWALECFPCLEPFTETLDQLGFVDVSVREISWRIAPTVLQAPWTVVSFILRKMAEGEKLDEVRKGHLKACFLSLAIGLFRSHYGYYLISGRKPGVKLPVVAVFGGGDPPPEIRALAEQAGAAIAHQGWHLLTGGGPGVMEAAARGFAGVEERKGLALGIVPGPHAPPGYPNTATEVAVFTPLTSAPSEALNRNWVNVRTAWGALVLPGGAGTAQELALCHELGTPARPVDRGSELAEALGWLAANLSDPATR